MEYVYLKDILQINKDLIKDINFILEHRKSKYIIYSENFGEDLKIEMTRKYSAEYVLFKLGVKEFTYISSNSSSYVKELHLFPKEEYECDQFKYLKKKEK